MNNEPQNSENPAVGEQVITACAFIHMQIDGVEKVFLAKRADSKKFLPGVYELPGGHIDYGEDIRDGLEREIMEEFGRHIKLGDPFAAFTYLNDLKGSHSIEVIYFAKFTDESEIVSLNQEDHSEYGWFSEDELIKATTPSKGMDDEEFVVMNKAFSLLRRVSLDY